MHVFLVEEDEELGRELVTVLGQHGHQVLWCDHETAKGIQHVDTDLMLLDPDRPGWAGAPERPRAAGDTPVVVLAAQATELSWADDYVAKPVDLAELVAMAERVVHRAALRANRVVTALDVTVRLADRTVWVRDRPVHLCDKEFQVLAVLANHAGRVVPRRHLEQAVWGATGLRISRNLNVHLTTLRRKINRPTLIQTVWGEGYRFGGPAQC